MNKLSHLFTGAIIGALLFFIWTQLSKSNLSTAGEAPTKDINEPLYWVAPMDPNFRRDQPGLSPMGMKLVPVYANNDDQGGIQIASHVVNNLGVKTTTVTEQNLAQTIKTVGFFQYNDNLINHVHPRVSGWIHQLYTKTDGVSVSQGDPLFSLYAPELVNAQEEYILALSRQQNQLIQATEARLHSLQLSPSTIKQIKANRKAIQNITFYADKDGVISDLQVKEGQYVTPNNEIMTLANLEKIWLEVELSEQQLSKVKLNDSVSVKTNAVPGQELKGQVAFIYPFLDPKSKTGKVRLSFDNQQLILKPHMVGEVTIVPKQRQMALAVPKDAVIRSGYEDRVVWSMGDGQFKSVAVTLGASNDLYHEVTEGLEPGDEVVVSAQFLIDSESNKTSDLQRYNASPSAMDMSMDMDSNDPQTQTATTSGVINQVTAGIINIDREAIEKWNRPAANVDFKTALNIDLFKPGSRINFTFEVNNGEFIIIEVSEAEEN